MKVSFIGAKVLFLSLVLSILMSISVVYAEVEEKKSSTNTTVDSILGAIADMTVDQAKGIINLRFTRNIREKVCGYESFKTDDIELVFEEKDKINIRKLFTETCRYVRDKIERNIFSDQLIEAFKKDLVINGILLVSSKISAIRGPRSTLSILIENRDKLIKDPEEYKKELLAVNFIYLIWKKVPISESVQQALSESDSYRAYSSYIEVALGVAEELKKEKNVIRSSIDIKIESNKLKLIYKKFEKNALSGEKEILISTSLLLGNIDSNFVSIFFRLAGAIKKESQKKYTRELLVLLLNGGGCQATCVESINRLIDMRVSDLFDVLTELLANSEKSDLFGNDDDIDNRNSKNYKALRVLNSLTELSNVQDKASARAILDKYLADENTRSIRYWEKMWTLGTLFGVSTGRTYCPDCVEKNRYLTPNLYMPFGLFYTYGRGGIQLHIFDLGQYTTINNEKDKEETINFRDALAPGFAVFGRLRRYPISFGIDYSYKSDRSGKTFSENQLRAFIAMDIHLFKLN